MAQEDTEQQAHLQIKVTSSNKRNKYSTYIHPNNGEQGKESVITMMFSKLLEAAKPSTCSLSGKEVFTWFNRLLHGHCSEYWRQVISKIFTLG